MCVTKSEMYSLKGRKKKKRSNLLECRADFIKKDNISMCIFGMFSKLVSQHMFYPEFLLSLCLFSSFSPSLPFEPAHLHARRYSGPSDHLAGTQLHNCVSRQMLCKTVEDGEGG